MRTEPGKAYIAATDASSACVAIHRLLRGIGHWVTWESTLPIAIDRLDVIEHLDGTAIFDDLYNLNFCVSAYSTPFWGWTEWEREIDWMALHGVTMPLQLVGHEAVLEHVYTAHGISTEQVRRYLGSPVYLPFVYMGCVDSLGEPVSDQWMAQRAELGRRIIERQRELGMTPVLPAFIGHVPASIAPNEVHERRWHGVSTFALPSSSPLIASLTAEIVRAQQDLFGVTDHRYACDPFIETTPDQVDVNELRDGIVAGLRSADPEAIWVFQSWPFSYQSDYWNDDRAREFLDGFPPGSLQILDLAAEAHPQWNRFDSFAPRPWLWCGLLNFGGRSDLVADLPAALAGVESARLSGSPPIGLGLGMEAIHVTSAFFELICAARWSIPDDVDGWLDEFGAGRYGGRSPVARTALRLLGRTVLDTPATSIAPDQFISMTVRAPSYSMLDDPEPLLRAISAARRYEIALLLDAWRALADAADAAGSADGPLGDDLAGVGITVMNLLIDHYLGGVLRTAQRGQQDVIDLSHALDCIDALDRLASSRHQLRLSTWEGMARAAAATPEEERNFERAARRLITIWADPSRATLNDYAARLWAGITSGYYRERWRLWAAHLTDALDPDRRTAAEAALAIELADLADAFVADGVEERDPADLLTVTRELMTRWQTTLADIATASAQHDE